MASSKKKVIRGTSERLRLSVSRSLKHVGSQLIDDSKGVTVVSASTKEKDIFKGLDVKGKQGAAKQVGKILAQRALEKGVLKVFFDRGDYHYHGRVQALAEGAREGGLVF